MYLIRFLLVLTLFAASLSAQAAGMVVHALMADYGRQHLPSAHPLKRILDQHRPALLAGALYPDGGYATGALFPGDRDVAENAHWEYFVNPLMQLLHERGCAAAVGADVPVPVIGGTIDFLVDLQQAEVPLADIRRSDSCGSLVAFAMGIAAHGMGDEVWDALFEPVVRERGEHIGNSPANTLDTFPPGADTSVGQILRGIIGDAPFDVLAQAFDPLSLNSIEYAMDVMAIFEHDLWLQIPFLEFPPDAVLVEAYARTGRNDPAVTAFAVQRAALATRTLVLAERAAALGCPEDLTFIDPTHDFGKNTFHGLELLRRIDEVVATGWPVLMALSNKDFVGETLDRGVGERVAGTLAATAWSAARGVAAFRVHEVAETVDVIRMTAAIQGEVAPLVTTRGLA